MIPRELFRSCRFQVCVVPEILWIMRLVVLSDETKVDKIGRVDSETQDRKEDNQIDSIGKAVPGMGRQVPVLSQLLSTV